MNDIFSKKHLKDKTIDNKLLEKLKNNAQKLLKEKHCPLDYFSQYIAELLNKTSKEFHNNLNEKRIEIYQSLNNINDEITKQLNLKQVQKEIKDIDIKNFDIEAFRKEYALSQEEHPDEKLNKLFIRYKGNFIKMFEGLFG